LFQTDQFFKVVGLCLNVKIFMTAYDKKCRNDVDIEMWK